MRHLFLILFICWSTLGESQEFEQLFGNLSGQELLEAIQDNYTTDTVLSYSMARDTLFANVFASNDTLECVYSGWKRYLDPNLDPTQAVFTNNGDNEDINTEHSYPRSMGAFEGTPGYSDMHHLFPTRAPVNTARSNDIFMEIPDNQTASWYYQNETQSNIPNLNINEWAEDINEGFEPRESSKGDVARAVFYFYTIYQEQAVNASPEFFELQRETLCHWAADDQANQDELLRTLKIAEYQGDIPNPFIVDCSLAERLYCQDIPNDHCFTSTEDIVSIDTEWKISPNPSASNRLIIEADRSWTHARLIDYRGVLIRTIPLSTLKTRHIITLDRVLPAGTYQVQLTHRLDHTISKSKPWIKL